MGHISKGESQNLENDTQKGPSNRKGKLSQIEHYQRALEQLAKVKMAKSSFGRW